jgi:hypothetical protein
MSEEPAKEITEQDKISAAVKIQKLARGVKVRKPKKVFKKVLDATLHPETVTLQPDSVTYMEPIIALALDLEMQMLTLGHQIFNNSSPTMCNLNDLLSLEAQQTLFKRLMDNMSKNADRPSVRLYELTEKLMDNELDTLYTFTKWSLMNALPDKATFNTLMHLEELDSDYALGLSTTLQGDKRYIYTYAQDSKDGDTLELEHFQIQKGDSLRYSYKLKESGLGLSVLGAMGVEETNEDATVVDVGPTFLRFRQLQLNDKKKFSLFLKADEYKQKVVREKLAKHEKLVGGAGEEKEAPPNMFKGVLPEKRYKPRQSGVSVMTLFWVALITLSAVLGVNMLSHWSLSYGRCTWKERVRDMPECVPKLFVPFQAHIPFQLSYEASDEIVNSNDNSFQHTLDVVSESQPVPVANLYQTVDHVVYNIGQMIKRSSLPPDQKPGVLVSMVNWLSEAFQPGVKQLVMNLQSEEAVDVMLRTLDKLDTTFQNVTLDTAGFRLYLINLKSEFEGAGAHVTQRLNVNDKSLLQLQTEMFVFQNNLNDNFVHLNTRYQTIFNTLSHLLNVVETVKEDFESVLQTLSNVTRYKTEEEQNTSYELVVFNLTNYEENKKRRLQQLTGTKLKATLHQLSFNYQCLRNAIALPLYTLHSQLHTFPTELQLILDNKIRQIVQELLRLHVEMMLFKTQVGLQNENFIVNWLAVLFADTSKYESVLQAERLMKQILDVQLEILKKNQDSFKLMSQVVRTMGDKQVELKRKFSVAKENVVTANLQMLSQFVVGYATHLPKLVGLTDQFFSDLSFYLDFPEHFDNLRAELEDNMRDFREKVKFSSLSRVAAEGAYSAWSKILSILYNSVSRVRKTVPRQRKYTQGFLGMLEYALAWGIQVSESAKATTDFFTLGTIPSVDISFPSEMTPTFMRDLIPSLKISGANVYDWTLPRVELSLMGYHFMVPEHYLTEGNENPSDLRKSQIMSEHLLRMYTDYNGPLDPSELKNPVLLAGLKDYATRQRIDYLNYVE